MPDRGLSNVNKVSGGVRVRDLRTGEIFTVDRKKARIARLRRRVFSWVEATRPVTAEGYRMVMQTLTYERVEDWRPGQIREYMLFIRHRLGGRLVAYSWVAELQQRGAVHYHLLLIVKRGTRIPKPDLAGWWPWGLTRVETAKTPYYIAKYAGKEYQKLGPFPKGLRIFAVWISDQVIDMIQKWYFRLSTLPGWFRDIVLQLPAVDPSKKWVRPPGGGWLYMGVFYASPYELVQ
jgi:hypothetical protein